MRHRRRHEAPPGIVGQTTVGLNLDIVREAQHDDVTEPNLEVSAMLAAQDQFEATKQGEANAPPVEEALRALNQVTPEMDWPTIQAKIAEAVQDLEGEVSLEGQKIVVRSSTADKVKDLSARIWRVLGELRKSQQIRSLPTVEMRVG